MCEDRNVLSESNVDIYLRTERDVKKESDTCRGASDMRA